MKSRAKNKKKIRAVILKSGFGEFLDKNTAFPTNFSIFGTIIKQKRLYSKSVLKFNYKSIFHGYTRVTLKDEKNVILANFTLICNF